jgi:hypothetical protein
MKYRCISAFYDIVGSSEVKIVLPVLSLNPNPQTTMLPFIHSLIMPDKFRYK